MSIFRAYEEMTDIEKVKYILYHHEELNTYMKHHKMPGPLLGALERCKRYLPDDSKEYRAIDYIIRSETAHVYTGYGSAVGDALRLIIKRMGDVA